MNRGQRGGSLLLVLILLTVALLGALSTARLVDLGTNVAGNIAFRNAAEQAAEVGVSEAFARLRAAPELGADLGTWYRALSGEDDEAGMPVGVDWDEAPEVLVGPYSVRFFVQRLCSAPLPVVDATQQCVIQGLPQVSSARAGPEALGAPPAMTYRVTVAVSGPKSTQAFVQQLVVL